MKKLSIQSVIYVLLLLCSVPGCRTPPPLTTNQTIERNGVLFKINDTEPYTGEVASYYLTGKLKLRAIYQQGMLNGSQTEFRQDGQPLAVSNWKAGQRHGAESDWYENGQKSYEGLWANDRPAGEFRGWYPDGKPAFRITLKDGAGKGRILRLTWNETIIKEYKDVKIEGAWIEWHKFTSRITRQEIYKDGELIEKRN